MKNWMKNIICSREWTGIASGMDRAKSRMTSIKTAYNPVMILTFLFLVLGGFTTRTWGVVTTNVDTTTVTFRGDIHDWGGDGTMEYVPKSGAFELTPTDCHVTFSLKSPMTQYNAWKGLSGYKDPKYFFLNKDNSSSFTWSVGDGYTINVSAIYFNSCRGKSYVRTSHIDAANKKLISEAAEGKFEDKTFAVSDASNNIFGEIGLTNRDSFVFYATEAQWNIKTITLTYTVGNNYAIRFNGNGSTSGSMSVLPMAYYIPKNLTANAFIRSYSVTYDEDGGSTVADAVATYSFAGWATSAGGSVVYSGGARMLNLTETINDTIDLYAKWSGGSITLPTPTHATKSFAGWYNGDVTVSGNFVGGGGATIYPTSDLALTAKWTDADTPTFTGADQSMKVGEGYTGFSFTHTSTSTPSSSSDDKFYYVITKDTVKTENTIGSSDGSKVIAVETAGDVTTIRALNKGVASITFYQKKDTEGGKNIAAGNSTTFKFTVDKNDPEFTWPSSGTYYYNDTVEHFFKSSNTATDIEVSPSPANIATIVDSALVTYNRAGTTTITMTQAENYYWNEYSESRTITPQKAANHVPFVYTEAMKNNTSITTVGVNTTASWDDNSNLWLVNNGGDSKDDKYVIIKIEGYPDSLKFVHRTSDGGSSGADWYIKASIDNVSWPDTNVWSVNRNSSSWSDTIRLKLNPATRYLKLCYSGTNRGYYKTLTVSEKKQFSIDNDALDFKTNLRGSTPDPQKVTFTHRNACYTVNVASSDETHYQVGLSSSGPWSGSLVVPNTGGDKMGSTDIYVKYIPTTALEEETHNANITISDLDSTQTISVTGTTQAHIATRLVYTGSKSYNANNDNIAATAVFTLYDANDVEIADPAITLSSSNTGVINIVEDDTEMDFVCSNADSITITASYDGDGETYASTSKTQKILVNKAADVITWDAKVVNDTLRVWSGDTIPYTIATAHTSEDKPITFTSRDATILRVGSGVAIDTLITLKYDTVWLVAQTAADCKYSSVKDSIVVVVKPCPHRIVWTDDFAGLHTEEDGKTIDYTSEPMSAYAVDSTSKSTGVSISYSLSPGTTIAEIDKDNKLHVTGVGETMVYATTAADDKYAVVTDSLLVRVLTWGENHAKIVQDEFEGNREWSGPHAKFVISGDGQSTTTFGGDGRKLAIEKNKVQTISWTVDDNCTINVTGLKLKVGSSSPGNGDFNLYGERVDKIAGWNTNVINITTLSQGNSGNITLSGSKDFNIYYLDVTYTITPSVAPTPTEGVSEVYVTVDPESPVLLDISDVFSIADAPSDFTYVCDTIEKNSHVHFADGKTKFWADAIGDYTIKGRVAAAADHRPSAWSSTNKTIRVVRQPNKVYMGGSDNYNETIVSNSTKSGVSLSADNTDYVNYPITCTQIAGVDTISYNSSTGVITSGLILGVGKWRVSQAQSDKYEAAVDTFTVTIVKGNYDTPVAGGNWSELWPSGKPTLNDSVTIGSNVTIDEEVEVYYLGIADGDTVTIAPTGGLSIGAGGINIVGEASLCLRADSESKSATKGQTGYLRISPDYEGDMPEATVELYSKGYYDRSNPDKNDASWQYVGAPIDFGEVKAKTVYTRSWIYDYDESTDTWSNHRSTLVMQPFVGYATTQYDDDDGKLLAYPGQLVPNRGLITLDLEFTDAAHGHNMVANSFAAPIDITQFRDTDFVNAEKTIYIFNTGSKNQENTSVRGDAAGQYRTIAIGTAEEMAALFEDSDLPTTIASMQGFWVRATKAGAKLKLNYEKLVWNANYGTHQPKPLRAPKRNVAMDVEEAPITGAMKITLEADGWTDNVYLMESKRYKLEYEDGYDAHKMERGNLNIFAMVDEEKLAIDATSRIADTKIGVRTGEETAYTMHFSYVQGETDWTLIDTEAGKEIDIEEDAEYSFYAEPNETITERFLIVERAKAPAITTGTDDIENEAKVHKFVKDNSLYILKDGVLYDGMGRRVQ